MQIQKAHELACLFVDPNSVSLGYSRFTDGLLASCSRVFVETQSIPFPSDF